MPKNARTVLARKEITAEKKLILSGFTIQEKTLHWVIPSILFSLSFYFLTHVLHIKKLLTKIKEPKQIIYYPWIAIMQGKLAAIMSLFTIVILPLITIVSLSTIWPNDQTTLNILFLLLGIISCILQLISFYILNSISKNN